MARIIPPLPPELPPELTYQVGRDASGAASAALASLGAHTLGVRALRCYTHRWDYPDWTQDVVPLSPEVRRVAYRPSPFAARAMVVVWYGSRWDGSLASSRPPTRELVASLLDDATLTVQATHTWTTLPSTPARGYAAQFAGAAPEDSGKNSGTEQGVLTILDVSGLDGGDGWLALEYNGVVPLALAVVELAEGAA